VRPDSQTDTVVRNIAVAPSRIAIDGIVVGGSRGAAMADVAGKTQELCGAIEAGVRIIAQVGVCKCACRRADICPTEDG
jgi:hypothetical protein